MSSGEISQISSWPDTLGLPPSRLHGPISKGLWWWQFLMLADYYRSQHDIINVVVFIIVILTWKMASCHYHAWLQECKQTQEAFLQFSACERTWKIFKTFQFFNFHSIKTVVNITQHTRNNYHMVERTHILRGPCFHSDPQPLLGQMIKTMQHKWCFFRLLQGVYLLHSLMILQMSMKMSSFHKTTT